MSGPSIYFTLPHYSKFKFPPEPLPRIVPSASDEFVLKSPFSIPTKFYNDVLELKVPVTISLTYLVTVIILNAYNTRRNFKPWAISSTRLFKAFVLLHNLGLIIYSGVTFVAMLRAFRHIWPGINTRNGLAGAVDSLCKLHGPRGLGDAVTYNTTLNIWETKNELIRLAPNSMPQAHDVGRLWNEGLAFWGWLFYLSKFYEVADALVILAKGKRSPLLQTYHHSGIMITMWAGIRYMSPPIWMAVFLNSGIHTLMYTYYLLVALGIRVPNPIKRTMTTMQITQFVFGSTYAAAHLFLKYDIPIRTTFKVLHPVSSLSSVASSTLSEISTAVTEVASSPSAALASHFMRFLYRAAGDEGIAENIRDRQGQYLAPEVRSAVEHIQEKFREETRYRTEYATVDCVDTSGEVWAILINLFYLLPLTYLFLRFFYRAYLSRTSPSSTVRDKRRAARQSTVDAAKRVNQKFDKAGKTVERNLNDTADRADAGAIKNDIRNMRDGTHQSLRDKARRVSDRVDDYEERAKDAKDQLSDSLDSVKKTTPGQNRARQSDDPQGQSSSGSPKKKQTAVDDLHNLAESVKTSTEQNPDLKQGNGSMHQDGRASVAAISNDDNNEDDDDSGPEADASSPGRNQYDHDGQLSQDSPQKKKKKKNKRKKNSSGATGDAAGSGAGRGGDASKVSPSAGTYTQTQT